MKVTIRFSVDGGQDGALRNKLCAALEAKGIMLKRGNETATYESTNIAVNDLNQAFADFWQEAISHQGPGKIDHVWMYTGQ